MTIETKYDIGDEVWMMHKNKPTSMLVQDLTINRFQESMYLTVKNKIVYHMGGDPANTGYHEEQLYATKGALLASL